VYLMRQMPVTRTPVLLRYMPDTAVATFLRCMPEVGSRLLKKW
jgi:hypothetical protein